MKKLLLIITSLLLCFSLSSCSLLLFSAFNTYVPDGEYVEFSGVYPDEDEIYIDYEKSYFSEVTASDDGTVSYRCSLDICNSTDEDVTVSLLGDFEEEYDMGCITSLFLAGEDENKSTTFTLPANSEDSYTVIFKGTLAGNKDGALKHDRSLPGIEIHLADDEN